jgi:hypothetical protein
MAFLLGYAGTSVSDPLPASLPHSLTNLIGVVDIVWRHNSHCSFCVNAMLTHLLWLAVEMDCL